MLSSPEKELQTPKNARNRIWFGLVFVKRRENCFQSLTPEYQTMAPRGTVVPSSIVDRRVDFIYGGPGLQR